MSNDAGAFISSRYRGADVPIFNGKQDTDASVFMDKLDLFFLTHSHWFQEDRQRIAYAVSRLDGFAFKWAKPYRDEKMLMSQNLTYATFRDDFLAHYDEPDAKTNAAQQLLSLRTQKRTVPQLAAEFRNLALVAGWNDQALIDVFDLALPEEVRIQLCSDRSPVTTFPEYSARAVALSARLANRHNNNRSNRPTHSYSPPSHSNSNRFTQPSVPQTVVRNDSGPQPMMIDSVSRKLSPAERARRFRDNLCLYCGEPGHNARNCPLNNKKKVVAIVAHQSEKSGKVGARN